jgi:threonine/homoserine/homoserine lactone efflux protein
LDHVIGLRIFIAIAMAGCAFLVYFLVALWRDAHKTPRLTPVQNKQTERKGEVLQMYIPGNHGAEGQIGSGY